MELLLGRVGGFLHVCAQGPTVSQPVYNYYDIQSEKNWAETSGH